jgi:hypothetical protein
VTVLVQPELECGRSSLASIARAVAGRVARPNVTVTGPRKQRPETATGFKSRSVCHKRCARQRSCCAPSILQAGLDVQRLILEARDQLSRKRRILNPACAAHFKGMTYRASRGTKILRTATWSFAQSVVSGNPTQRPLAVLREQTRPRGVKLDACAASS